LESVDNQLADLNSGGLTSFGKFAHLRGDDCKTFSMFTCAGRFDCGIQR
jgi:hypothetical protein